MNLAAILAELRARGIVAFAVPDDPDAVEVAGPGGAMTSDLMERLRDLKPELLTHLKAIGRDGRWRASDGPKGSIDPDAVGSCDRCRSFERWQSLAGTWRCRLCDPPSEAARRVSETVGRYRPWQ